MSRADDVFAAEDPSPDQLARMFREARRERQSILHYGRMMAFGASVSVVLLIVFGLWFTHLAGDIRGASNQRDATVRAFVCADTELRGRLAARAQQHAATWRGLGFGVGGGSLGKFLLDDASLQSTNANDTAATLARWRRTFLRDIC